MIRLAATGAAAYLIGKIRWVWNVFCQIKLKYFSDGTTFHTGLRFSYGNDYSGIREEQLNQLRKQFEQMMVVIIDEMSLVNDSYAFMQ